MLEGGSVPFSAQSHGSREEGSKSRCREECVEWNVGVGREAGCELILSRVHGVTCTHQEKRITTGGRPVQGPLVVSSATRPCSGSSASAAAAADDGTGWGFVSRPSSQSAITSYQLRGSPGTRGPPASRRSRRMALLAFVWAFKVSAVSGGTGSLQAGDNTSSLAANVCGDSCCSGIATSASAAATALLLWRSASAGSSP
mmetsp:Transcript_11010/g.34053  ORF Transcript_11010/g.34053 Transcript_11010/m.34053 type:complete len:200 (-) Transcript_11010:416-1015(-)